MRGFQWVRSLIFNIQMYLVMALMALYFTPLAVFDREFAYQGVRTSCRWVRWTAGWMIVLRDFTTYFGPQADHPTSRPTNPPAIGAYTLIDKFPVKHRKRREIRRHQRHHQIHLDVENQ